MNLMKRLMLLFLIAAISSALAYAHPGGTDSKGGHTNRSTGEYHYHHGYPEHQHTGGVCPYDFDDQTGKNSGTSTEPAPKEKPSFSDVSSDVLFLIVTLPLVAYVLFNVFLIVELILRALTTEQLAFRISRISYYVCLFFSEIFLATSIIKYMIK